MTTPTTSVPPVVFTSTGVVLPAESAILAGVQADMNAAFGGNLNPGLTTPQGQLASSMTAIIGDANSQLAQYFNQVNPAYAEGRMQDAIGYIYFLTRNPAEPTVIQVNCIGVAGTVIPAQTLVTDTAGNVYASTGAATIPSGGTIPVQFSNLVTGPIAIPSSVSIYQTVPGLDTVTFVSGILGSVVESQSAFEIRRQQSVAINATGTLPAIYANVFAVSGVLDCYVYENTTSASINVGPTNYSMLPHSIYVGVIGGSAAAIAYAIWSRKNVGADYNGNQSVVVTDQSGYSYPYPSYTVKYNIPTSTPIYFAVQIANTANLPANIIALTQAAIVNAFAGGDGGSRARIGSTLYGSRYYAPIAAVAPGVNLLSVFVGVAPSPTTPEYALGIDQGPTISAANISVTLV